MQGMNTKTQRFQALFVVIFMLLAAPGAGLGQMERDRFPDDEWMRFTNVEEAGFDPAKLASAKTTWEGLPSSALLVIADGAVVAAWGDVGRRFMCHSVRKSFLSALYGIYWDRGEIQLNKTLADLGIDDEPDPLLETEKQARILDLLKARSGVFHPAAYAGRTDSRPRGSEGPGRYFAYNNWDFNTSASILMQETGEDVFEAFDRYFGRPLKMEDWRVSDGYYHYEHDKSKYPAYPFRMSARDAARFGLLFARAGMWKNDRILSEHWINRSTALYSIDNKVFGYGFYWWISREPRFARYGMVSAQGVGTQMIAVLPKIDMVIVNRANTYQGEGTPMRQLLDLIEAILKARTGPSEVNPELAPLEAGPDPKATEVSNDSLTEFIGEWKYPPEPLGLPSTEFKITAGHGHLVGHTPTRGTFRLYLQNDGTLHQEDSHTRFFPVRDDRDSFVGIADVGNIMEGAIKAAGGGDGGLAARLMSVVEGRLEKEDTLPFEAVKVVGDLFGGREAAAKRSVQQLSKRFDPVEVERWVNRIGYRLMRGGMGERALELLEFNSRIHPESWNAWDSLSEIHLGLGNTGEALRAFQRSLELNPANFRGRARFQQAAIKAAIDGDNARAVRLLKAAGMEKTLQVGIANVVIDLFGGNGPSAEQAVRKLSERLRPASVERGVNATAQALMREGWEERALELFEFNTRIFPESWNAWDSLGEGHLKLGHKAKAISAYRKSLELNPDNEAAEKLIAWMKKEKRDR